MLFVQYPKCSTCRKAKNWLDEHNIEYESKLKNGITSPDCLLRDFSTPVEWYIVKRNLRIKSLT